MLARALERAQLLIADGSRLPGTPAGLVSLLRDGDALLGDYLDLDDPALWVALSAWQREKDPILSDLVARLRARRLFKTIELYGEAKTPRVRIEMLERAREAASRAGFEPSAYVGLDVASTIAFDDHEDPLSVVFPDASSRPLADVSFLLGRLREETLERVRLIFPAELRDVITSAIQPHPS
jgi:hypothetical protein